jgi:hypothetical protein
MPSGLVGDPSRKRLALPRNYLSQGLEVRGCKGLPLGPDRIRRSCLRTTTARTTRQVERIREENKATLTLTLLNTNEALRVHCPSDLFWRVLEKPIDHSKEDREKKTCVYLSHRFGVVRRLARPNVGYNEAFGDKPPLFTLLPRSQIFLQCSALSRVKHPSSEV